MSAIEQTFVAGQLGSTDIETSSRGVMLATVDDDQYYRETSFFAERNATGSGLTGSADVLEYMRELYPWVANNSGPTELSRDPQTGTFRVRRFHNHGSLTVFLNQSSGRVFAEHQRKMLWGVPTTRSIGAKKGRLHLRVARTYSTGPMKISLATPSGKPVDETVRINGYSAGRTGVDGQLWTIAPEKKVTIGVRRGDKSLRIQIPSQPRTNA